MHMHMQDLAVYFPAEEIADLEKQIKALKTENNLLKKSAPLCTADANANANGSGAASTHGTADANANANGSGAASTHHS